MERGGGRSPEERAAAIEARERSRVAREEGVPLEEDEAQGGGRGPEMGSIKRYGGGGDVYARRRLIAVVAVVAVILILFLLLGGC